MFNLYLCWKFSSEPEIESGKKCLLPFFLHLYSYSLSFSLSFSLSDTHIHFIYIYILLGVTIIFAHSLVSFQTNLCVIVGCSQHLWGMGPSGAQRHDREQWSRLELLWGPGVNREVSVEKDYDKAGSLILLWTKVRQGKNVYFIFLGLISLFIDRFPRVCLHSETLLYLCSPCLLFVLRHALYPRLPLPLLGLLGCHTSGFYKRLLIK